MGFFSGLFSAAASIFSLSKTSTDTRSSSSVSNTQTVYEPDKVKVVELEHAKMDRAIEAQKEIMQMNHEMQLVVMEANQKGFKGSTTILKDMMRCLNLIAQERLTLIENGHFEVVKKIEELYIGLEKEIREDNNEFNMSKLPEMLAVLNQFEASSPSAKLYAKSVDKQIELNATFFTHKLSALYDRQKIMVESTVKSKEQVLEQSARIVNERMRFLDTCLAQQQAPLMLNTAQAQAIETDNAVQNKKVEHIESEA